MIEHLRAALDARDVISEQTVEAGREEAFSRCAPLEEKIRQMSRELQEKEREIHVSVKTRDLRAFIVVASSFSSRNRDIPP